MPEGTTVRALDWNWQMCTYKSDMTHCFCSLVCSEVEWFVKKYSLEVYPADQAAGDYHVGILNTDVVTCTSTSACSGQLKSRTGQPIDLTGYTGGGFDVQPTGAGSCLKISNTGVVAYDGPCTQVPVCQTDCYCKETKLKQTTIWFFFWVFQNDFNWFPDKIDGGWTDWGEWQACSVTCSSGTRIRQKLCQNPSPSVDPQGAGCLYNSLEYSTLSQTMNCDTGVTCPTGGKQPLIAPKA